MPHLWIISRLCGRIQASPYIPSRERLQHVEAVLQLLSVMTEDSRFQDVLYDQNGSGGGVNNMCDVLDRVETRGSLMLFMGKGDRS